MDEQESKASNAMDEAADKAALVLDEILASATPSAEKVMGWWKANYMTAGHKRLGRILVIKAKALGL
jgi:hypothetical protein